MLGPGYFFIILIIACQECHSFSSTNLVALRRAAFSHGSDSRRAKVDRPGQNDSGYVDIVDGYQKVNSSVHGVTLKIAIDKQGGVADLSSEKLGRFTCGASLDMVHRLRRCSDGVLVGKATVVEDDCSLTVRRVPLDIVDHNEELLEQDRNDKRNPQKRRQQPVRVVIDSRKTLDLSKYTIAQDGLRTIIVHMNPTCVRYTSDEFPNVEFLGLPPRIESEMKPCSTLSSQEICEKLGSLFGIQHLMVEGGPQTANSFLRERMVDRAIIVRAPIAFRKPLLWEPWSSSQTSSPLEEAGLACVGTEMSGVDTIEYWSRPGNGWPSDPNPLSTWP
ncbi:unnamed protein product [Cylindrotheca closterium]|uniref:Bacterial bifunctional deaminase-reductase C-terminal domain-containing protein n=1 Tax=Cylindrotheca closterium TaxID=2856 RepID=A0AAD2FCV9_9STRA|nr:unnamed protein product [Cylindrotheca closterium]